MPELRFLGHAAFELRITGKTILFDPWITGNPKSPLASPDEITNADIILVTHDHYDHGFEDAVAIVKRTDATLVAIAELAGEAKAAGVSKVVSGNLGGTVGVGGIRISFVPAFHSAGVGVPCGFVVRHPDLTVYHAGDTSYFGDMHLLADERIDIALLPIGGTFTMDIRGAARAVEAIRPKTVVPMHYDTFPAIVADTAEFGRLVGHHSKVSGLLTGENFSW